MRRQTFVLTAIVFICAFLFSCSNVDDVETQLSLAYVETVQSKSAEIDADVAMEDFMMDVDELNRKYARPVTYGWGNKWGRRILCGIADATASAIAAPIATPVGGLVAGVVASGLYEDYLDYISNKMVLMDAGKLEDYFALDMSKPLDTSKLKNVKFNVETTTFFLSEKTEDLAFADSIGISHNSLLASLRKNGKKYVDLNGRMDYDRIYHDVKYLSLFIGWSDKMLPDSIAFVNMEKNDTETLYSAIRSFTEVFLRSLNPVEEDVDFVTGFERARLNSLDKLNVDKVYFDGVRDLGQKMMGTVQNLSDNDLVDYCKDMDTMIDCSNLDICKKNQFKTFNNVLLNSSFYWKQ